MACMKISNNKLSNNSSGKLLPSAITSYSVCNQTFIASSSSSDLTIKDYDNQVLFVIFDMYDEDRNKPNCTQCVICKDNFILPKITKCGHIFCYACIVGYMVSCGSTQMVKCPLCSRWIHAPELKSLIWRYIKKLKVGDNVKFHLYRFNIETNTIERMRENSEKTITRKKSLNSQSLSRHTFEYLWSHVQHLGNGQLFIEQMEHNFILPDNNIYFASENTSILTLFDIEKSVLIEKIGDAGMCAEEIMAYLACNDHFNDFIDRITKRIDEYTNENSYGLISTYNKSCSNLISSECRASIKTNTSNKKNDIVVNDSLMVTNHDGNLMKINISSIPIVPLVKPEFIKTPRDVKNRTNINNENDYRFKKYLFFYKNEVYFNTYMSTINCTQIVDFLLKHKCLFDDQLHLPINVEGVLLQVENYEPETALLADSIWKHCSSMVKFLGFCNLQLTHPYKLEIPNMGAIQYKYSIKTQHRPNHTASSTTSSITGEDGEILFENFIIRPVTNLNTSQYLPQSANNTTSMQNTVSDVYPDIQSYYYDYFGNRNDDFPTFD